MGPAPVPRAPALKSKPDPVSAKSGPVLIWQMRSEAIISKTLGSLKVLLFGHLLGYLLGYLFDKENKKESYK